MTKILVEKSSTPCSLAQKKPSQYSRKKMFTLQTNQQYARNKMILVQSI